MITFDDGPAKGQNLMLKRVPHFLRVTEEKGKWDGLDQINDEPTAGERLYAYELVANRGMIHINFGRGRGGFYPIANYKTVKDQPKQVVMRDTSLWQGWCVENAPEQ